MQVPAVGSDGRLESLFMPTRSGALAPLFAAHRELRAVVDAVLEGRQGRAVRDSEAARLSLGCYEVFGGDPASPGARRLVASSARPRELVYGNDHDWRRLIQDVHGEQVRDRPMRDFDPALEPHGLQV